MSRSSPAGELPTIGSQAGPRSVDIVLVGGGHAHVAVLDAFGRRPLPGVRLTLVARELRAAYSGMLPGWLAGHYPAEDCEIDLGALARFAGARLVHAGAVGLDPAARRLRLCDGAALSYDILSIDVGIVPDVSDIAGAAEHALTVKPISAFRAAWERLSAECERSGGIRTAVVVGGGAAGFELAHALNHRLAQPEIGQSQAARGDSRCGRGQSGSVTLVAGRHWLAGLPPGARHLAAASLDEAGIALEHGVRASAVGKDGVTLDDGRFLPADAVLVATRALAPPWLAETGLSCDAGGFLKTLPTLQVMGEGRVFAVGDCATIQDAPRPKSGVFAVRQGPVLADNLGRLATGRAPRPYAAQRRFLQLLALGDRDAIAVRGRLALRSPLLWHLKDRIDRAFVRRFTRPR